jgi:unsaturated chondroitin disaccharide hydrolase
VPGDCVPYVDFNAPKGPGQVRDTSAAAVAAAGLFDLARLDPGSPQAPTYRNTALATVAALTRAPYLSASPAHPSVLLHQSPHWTQQGIDSSFIYGDYFWFEAIARMRGAARADLKPAPVASIAASSSDANRPSGAVDNSLATRWSALGDGQWLQLDMGSPRSTSGVRIAQLNGERRSARFDVLGSLDGRTWTKLTSAISSGRTAAREDFSFPPTTTRFVRYVGHGTTESAWNSVTEMAALGP